MMFAEAQSQQGPIQTVVLELVLQSLVERLIAAGTLYGDDLVEMRAAGLALAREISGPSSPVVPCQALELERQITAWWDHFDAAPLHANDP